MGKGSKDIWLEYFDSIRSVCPWSFPAYAKNQIDIKPFFDYQPLGDYLARVYIYHLKPQELEEMMERLNDEYPHETWFWSHPKEGGHSAPFPVLIQQDTKYLESIRSHLKSPI